MPPEPALEHVGPGVAPPDPTAAGGLVGIEPAGTGTGPGPTGTGPGPTGTGPAGTGTGAAAEPPAAAAAPSLPVPAPRRTRRWRSILYGPPGVATRRRASDAVRAGAAASAVLACWLVTLAGWPVQRTLEQGVHPPPQSVSGLVTVVAAGGTVGVIVVLAGVALLGRRRRMMRDALLAGLVAWLGALAVDWVAGPTPAGTTSAQFGGADVHFPQATVAATVAVLTASLPFLSRNLRRLLHAVVLLGAVATAVIGWGIPLTVLAGAAAGWGVTAVVHLVVGSPEGILGPEEVSALLAELGVRTVDLVASPTQGWGVAHFNGADHTGRIDVSLYGRDAHDAQLLAKLFRFALYRDSGPTLTLTRAQQVEHEAYLTMLSARAGARGPDVMTAGTAGAAGDAVLVTRPPPGCPLDQLPPGLALSDDTVAQLLGEVLVLRRAGIAHGAISPSTVVVSPEGAAGLVDFRVGSVGAPGERTDRDLAAALATVALAVGPHRTVQVASRVLPAEALAAALPFLQRAALNPSLSRALRGHKELVAELRQRGAQATGEPAPKLAEPRRISRVNLVVVVGSVVGGWALIGVLIDVGRSWSTIAGAGWGWVATVFVLAQLVYPALAMTTVGSVTDPMPVGRTVALEVANSFVGLAAGSAGTLASRVRFFQQQGYGATLAVSSAVVASTASWVVKGGLFLIALPLSIGAFHFTSDPSGGSHTQLVWLIVLVLAAAGIVLGIGLAVPRYRRLAADKLRPRAAEVWSHLKVLSGHPRNLVEIFGGDVAAQLLVAAALGASLRAFDEHLSLPVLLVVLTTASMLGGVSPVPGGMGVVEAGMILALSAAGIPEDVAVAATFVQRLFTAYLPPIWGWFILIWMRRREYL